MQAASSVVDPLVRRTKRQRLEQPVCWMECESLETVVVAAAAVNSSSRWIRTPVATPLTQELFLDRLQKEIVTPFQFSLSSQIRLLSQDDTVPAAKERRRWIQSRLRVGGNACAQALEQAACDNSNNNQAPTLLVLTSSTSTPSTVAQSILPALAHRAGTPVLLLSSGSSTELGRLLGIRRVSALAFVPAPPDCAARSEEEQRVHAAVDSFVEFGRSKVAPQQLQQQHSG